VRLFTRAEKGRCYLARERKRVEMLRGQFDLKGRGKGKTSSARRPDFSGKEKAQRDEGEKGRGGRSGRERRKNRKQIDAMLQRGGGGEKG